MKVTMRQFLALLGAHGVMAGDSWSTWRTALIGAQGEALTAEEISTFRRITGRNPPATPDRARRLKLVGLFIGRRGGKDTAAAVVVIFNALCRRWSLAAGEVGTVLVIAVDRVQAQVEFKRVIGILQAVPALAAEIDSVTRETIALVNGVEIAVGTADLAAVRGRTLLCVVLDEFAFLSPEQALELLRALRPGLATQPGALIVVITTIYAAHGSAYDLFRQWGEDRADQLIIKGTTRDFNPTISEEFIAGELARDYAANAAEYLTIPRSDLEALFDAALIDSATRATPRELPRLLHLANGTPIVYHAAVDVSGGRQDAAAAAVTHRDGERVVVDACRRWPSPHDPVAVAREVAAFLAGYGLSAAHADQYGAELSRSIYAEVGVSLIAAGVNRSEAYLHTLPLFTSGRIEIPDEPVLRQELLGLERRTGRSGKDAVDHPPGAHDDLANAAALACWAAARAGAGEQEIWACESEALAGYDDQFGGAIERLRWNTPY